ncbi:MurR/RpiR family transcriptional regulator [Bacillus sp. S2(2019)]|jgi:DNA-binding MurR/RpiR family transcriptional regulator|nr:transcriptional family [Bacillus stratosphericus LAMA 585]MDF9415806.1 MurR/RpiR family transcriptional regulator [Bacillus altitudinis]TKD58307.1 MurR/RpiR family transcriptional regulator [Bacillus sp. S2(2019)]
MEGCQMDVSQKSLKTMISNTKLTKKEEEIAEYILNNVREACLVTSIELAHRLKVSNATVVRFPKKLGFSGYSDFQKYLREQYYDKSLAISDDVTIPSERLKLSYDKVIQSDLLNDNLKILEKNIYSISEKNSSEEFNKAINYIIDARRVYILGSRARTGLTEIMGVFLNQIIDHVVINSQQSFTPFDSLASCSQDDCVLIFSFPRYSEVDFAAAKMAKEINAKVVIITDKATAPIAHFADVLLLVSVDSNAFFNSYTPVLFLAELICTHVSRATVAHSEEKLERINKHISQFGMY